jgi:hypothetical protein
VLYVDPTGNFVQLVYGAISGAVGGFTAGYAKDRNLTDAFIGAAIGGVIGVGTAAINPFASNSTGALAATAYLGVSNAVGQISGDMILDIKHGRPVDPFDNFSLAEAGGAVLGGMAFHGAKVATSIGAAAAEGYFIGGSGAAFWSADRMLDGMLDQSSFCPGE